MKRVLCIGAILILCASALVISDEIVSRANGQKIRLNDDSTWTAVADTATAAKPCPAKNNVHKPEEAVEVWEKSLCMADAKCGKAVALYLHYCNLTGKKIVGLTVAFSIETNFGKIAFDDTVNDEVALEPYEKKRSDTYWRFADNPFLIDEPYDKLWQLAENGTAKISTKILKVIFDDGSTLPAAPSLKPKAKKKKK